MRIPIALLLVLVACRTGAEVSVPQDAAPETPTPRHGPATPAALLELLTEAEREGRFVDTLALRVPEERAVVVWATWFGAAYNTIAKSGAIVEQYQTLLTRHGLDEKWLDADATGPGGLGAVARDAFADVELGECYQDFARFNLAWGQHGVAYGFGEPHNGLEIDGDSAVALFGERSFTFVKQDDVWYWRSLKPRD